MLENDLIAELEVLCPRVHIGTAPNGTEQPYVTWQHIGGDPLRYRDNEPAAQRNALIQVNTWAATSLEALQLLLAIEEALCLSARFQASPHGEPIGAYDEGDTDKGYLQTYSITGVR